MNINKKTRYIVYTGLFSALAIILYFIEFPVFTQYLKVDLGDLPAAIAAILLGPSAGVLVEFVKNIIHLVIRGAGETMGYGDLINFIVGSAYVVPVSILTRAMLNKNSNLAFAVGLSGVVGLISMVAIGVLGNYLVAPLYFQFMLHITLTGPALWGAIGSATLLNLLKSILLTFLLVPLSIAGKKYFLAFLK